MPKIDLAEVLPPVDVDPNTTLGRLFVARGMALTGRRHVVYGTRTLAREVLERLPTDPTIVDCQHIRVMTAPFLHELQMARDDLTFVNMNEAVYEAWKIVEEWMNR